MKQKVLITGGLGFVGMQLAYWLPETYKIVVTDVREPREIERRFLSSRQEPVDCRILDVLDFRSMHRLFEDERINHVIHAAAVTSGYEDSPQGRAWAARLNVGGTLNVLEASLRTKGLQSLLFMSSSGIYIGSEPAAGQAQREEGDFPLESLYAVTKRASEILLEQVKSGPEVRIASARLGSVYGPLEMSTATRQGISQIGRLARALKEGSPVKLYGPDITRDWIYGRDLADCAGRLLSTGRWNYSVYNFGTGRPVSFIQIARIFSELGLQVEWTEQPDEADVVMTDASWRAALDMSRLKADTGFEPGMSIEQAIRDLCERESKL